VIDFLAPSVLYSLLKDVIGLVLRKRRRLSPSEVLELRHKWKPLFEAHVWKKHRDKLTSEIIVRDMKRIDNYPDAKETRGISPWFRAALVGTYHRGIYAGLRWGTLTKQKGGGEHWRFTDRAAGEKGDVRVLMIGSILYEDIDNVDWDGDEYYSDPHVYCFFTHKQKEPYEHTGFYTKTTPTNGLPFYIEVAPYEQVRRLSKRLGIRDFS
jgi:hypothetical protein